MRWRSQLGVELAEECTGGYIEVAPAWTIVNNEPEAVAQELARPALEFLGSSRTGVLAFSIEDFRPGQVCGDQGASD